MQDFGWYLREVMTSLWETYVIGMGEVGGGLVAGVAGVQG